MHSTNKYFFILILLLAAVFATNCSRSTRPDSDSGSLLSTSRAIRQLSTKIIALSKQRNRLRIAIIPPVLAGDSRGDRGFGLYLADRLTSQIKQEEPQIRLFERQRLQLILKEHALGQSGILNEKEAKRLGELVPIDALLTGSYTPLDNRVEIHFRLIDVVTGEILLAAGESLEISGPVKDYFFYTKTGTTSQTSTSVNIQFQDKDPKLGKNECAWKNEINSYLGDLTDSQRQYRLYRYARQIPLFSRCGTIHSYIANTYSTYKIYHRDYHHFLLQEIQGIQDTLDYGMVYRLLDVFGYFQMDQKIDHSEWQAGLNALRFLRTGYYHGALMGKMLNVRFAESQGYDWIERHIQELSEAARSCRFGKPIPYNYERGLEFIYGGIYRDKKLLQSFIEKYRDDFNAKLIKRIGERIQTTYRDKKLTDSDRERHEVIDTLCTLYNIAKPEAWLAKELIQVTYILRNEFEYKRSDDFRPYFIKQCRKPFEESMHIIPHRNENAVSERVQICIAYNLNCKLQTPNIENLAKEVLFGATVSDRRKAAEMLEKFGPGAKPSEATIIKTLHYINQKQLTGVGVPNLAHSCVTILANIKTKNANGLRLIASQITTGYGTKVDETIVKAFRSLGADLLPYLYPYLKNSSKNIRYRTLRALADMGTGAQKALPYLRTHKNSLSNEYERDLVEQTIYQIEKTRTSGL